METNDESTLPLADDEQEQTAPEPTTEQDALLDEAGLEVSEDQPELLGSGSRTLNDADSDSDGDPKNEEQGTENTRAGTVGDDTSDVGSIRDDADVAPAPSERKNSRDWIAHASAHKVVVELKRIETEVRALLEDRDTVRKRKLAGTRRWVELEDDLIQWRFSGRIDEPTLRRLQELVSYRHYLFHKLSFLAVTRPVWNS